jgi:Transposase DDE domain
MAGLECGAAINLDEAVRMFQKLLPPEDFNTREGVTTAMVYTPWIVTWLMIYQCLNGASLADAVGVLAGMDDDLVPKNKRIREKTVSANTGAYSGARSRLNVEAAEYAADQVFDGLMAHGASASTMGERRTFLVDGSTLGLAMVDSLREAYPPPKNQHGPGHRPALRLLAAHELTTGTMIRPEIGQINGAKAIGEVEMAGPLLERLPKNSIVIGDRNFGIFLLAWKASQTGHDFLLRLTQVRFKALVRKAKQVGPGAWQLTWEPSPWDRKYNPGLPGDATISVRLHEVRVSDNLTLWLVTSLDANGTTLATMYHERLHIETDLRDFKQTLGLGVLCSHSPEMIRKELATATIAYNLVVLIRKLAAAEVQVEPRRLSFARVCSLVRVLLLQRMSALEPAQAQEHIDQVLRMAGQCKIPHRPGRSYPRQAFAKPTKYPRRTINRVTKPLK